MSRKRTLWLASFLAVAIWSPSFTFGSKYGGGGGGMNVTLGLEAANPQEVNQKVSEILKKYEATINSVNSNQDPRSKSQQMSIQATLKQEHVESAITEMSAIAKINSRNSYNANTTYGAGTSPELELAALDKEIRQLRIGLVEHVAVAGILQRERQNLMTQIKTRASNQGLATLSISIYDENYMAAMRGGVLGLQTGTTVQANAESGNRLGSQRILYFLAGGVTALLGGALGYFVRKKTAVA